MENKKKATKAQRERIENMLKSGLIDRKEAQEMIERVLSREAEDKLRVAFWDGMVQDRGEAIMDVIRPFYSWQPKLKLARPDLQTCATRAFSKWRHVEGIHPTHTKEGVESLERMVSVGASLRETFGSKSPLEGTLRDEPWSSLRKRFHDLRDGNSDLMLWETVSEGIQELLLLSTRAAIFEDDGRSALVKPAIDLWLTGNFPIGFDKDDNLLVLVADK